MTGIQMTELVNVLQNSDDAPNAAERVVAKYLFYKN